MDARSRRLVRVSLALGLLLAGCGSGQKGSTAPLALSRAQSASPAANRVSTLADVQQAAPESRKLAYKASERVRVRSVAKAVDEATKIGERENALLVSQQAELQTRSDATVVFQVPPDRFRPFLEEIGDLGTVLSQSIETEDVTRQLADLDGRLKTSVASADRLREFLTHAPATADVVSIEAALEKREQEIDQLQRQLATVQERVDFSTVTVELTERGTAKPSKNIPGFLRGLRAGWATFVNVVMALLTVLGASLPFLPFVLIAVLGLRRFSRRSAAQRRAQASGSEPG